MRQFYAEYSAETFLAQVAREVLSAIPWWHHVVLLGRVKNPSGRFYYIHAAAKLGWSRNVLLNQIKARAYERSLAEGKTHNFPAVSAGVSRGAGGRSAEKPLQSGVPG